MHDWELNWGVWEDTISLLYDKHNEHLTLREYSTLHLLFLSSMGSGNV